MLERLVEPGSELSTEDLAGILRTKSVTGVGAALAGTRDSLRESGIRLDEALIKRSVRGRTVWSQGPRIQQTIHALRRHRHEFIGGDPDYDVPVEDVGPDYPGPVLVLRALKSRWEVFLIEGGLRELDDILNEEWFDFEQFKYESIGEVFIDRIEPREHRHAQPIPSGCEEDGIWVRGRYDYAEKRVPGAHIAGMSSDIHAWLHHATWVERRIVLVDAVRQVKRANLDELRGVLKDIDPGWRPVEPDRQFQYVKWVDSAGVIGRGIAPPLRMRLRCWYEVVIETAAGTRFTLRQEGLRGDHERTAVRAIARWREKHAKSAGELVVVREVRVAKRQPRPRDSGY